MKNIRKGRKEGRRKEQEEEEKEGQLNETVPYSKVQSNNVTACVTKDCTSKYFRDSFSLRCCDCDKKSSLTNQKNTQKKKKKKTEEEEEEGRKKEEDDENRNLKK